VVLLLTGAWLGRATARHTTATPHVDVSGVRPATTAGGVPVGYARSGDGAVAAATTYLAALAGRTVLDPAARRAALDAVVLPAARAEVERTLRVDPAGAARAGLPVALADGSLVARTIPAASRLRAYDPDSASVEVWTVSLLGTRSLGKVTAAWSTTTVTLRWSGGDWRLAGLATRSGPVPSTGGEVPSRYDDLLTATANLDGYSYAPRR
jgi:hypothetical protein